MNTRKQQPIRFRIAWIVEHAALVTSVTKRSFPQAYSQPQTSQDDAVSYRL